MTSTSGNQTVRIFGVVHSDEQNLVEIPEQSPSPLSAVYHESAEPGKDGEWKFLVYAVITTPTALRTYLKHSGDVNGRSMCEKAARRVANREGLELRNMGMPRLTRARRIWYHAIVWFPTLYVLKTMSYGIPLLLIVLLMTVALFLVLSPLTTWDEHRIREQHLGESIARDLGQRPDHPAIVVLGSDHTDGVASWLEDAGYETRIIKVTE